MKNILIIIFALFFLYSCEKEKPTEKQTDQTQVNGELDRTVLPIKEPLAQTSQELDVRNAKMPSHFEVRAPEGAPNVILVLLDDLGFAGTSAFGGPVNTPTFDRVASEGLYYNNFHTTAVCSPTRAALKSGRNPYY